MQFDPAEANRKMAAEVQAAAEQKLGRPLTTDEEFKIWNRGSFMGLEAIDQNIHHRSPAELENYLAEIPRPDPLPEAYTRR